MPSAHDRFYPSRDPETGLEEDRNNFLARARITLGLPVLFYGTLRDPRLFELVVGRSMDSASWEHVTVPGYSTCEVRAGTGYPGIFYKDPDTAIDCLLISDLTRFEKTMVAWYEWDEYELQAVPLSDGRSAQVFIPDLDAIRREYGQYEFATWSFERWREGCIEQSIANARDWMRKRPDDRALARAGFFTMKDSARGREAVE